jgi:hypothetical protein
LSHFILFFQMLNCCVQPVPNRFFDLALIVVPVEASSLSPEELSGMWWQGSFAERRRHQVDENTFRARSGILFGIVIHTSQGVLENILKPPRSPGRTPVPARFEEFELEFQDIQEVTFIFPHITPLTSLQT